jgi:hypothetical protein
LPTFFGSTRSVGRRSILWKKKCGGVSVPELHRLKELERDNALLKRWSYHSFVEGRVTYLRTRMTSTPLVGRFNLLGADAAKVAVPTGAIVESIDVVGDVRQRRVIVMTTPSRRASSRPWSSGCS